MEIRKRVGGRFVSSKEPVVELGRPAVVPGVAVKSLRPTQCRTFAQKRVAAALPEIVDRFVNEAKQGSIAHAKALVGLTGIDKAEHAAPKAGRRRGKSLSRRLLEELKRGSAAAAEQADRTEK